MIFTPRAVRSWYIDNLILPNLRKRRRKKRRRRQHRRRRSKSGSTSESRRRSTDEDNDESDDSSDDSDVANAEAIDDCDNKGGNNDCDKAAVNQDIQNKSNLEIFRMYMDGLQRNPDNDEIHYEYYAKQIQEYPDRYSNHLNESGSLISLYVVYVVESSTSYLNRNALRVIYSQYKFLTEWYTMEYDQLTPKEKREVCRNDPLRKEWEQRYFLDHSFYYGLDDLWTDEYNRIDAIKGSRKGMSVLYQSIIGDSRVDSNCNEQIGLPKCDYIPYIDNLHEMIESDKSKSLSDAVDREIQCDLTKLTQNNTPMVNYNSSRVQQKKFNILIGKQIDSYFGRIKKILDKEQLVDRKQYNELVGQFLKETMRENSFESQLGKRVKTTQIGKNVNSTGICCGMPGQMMNITPDFTDTLKRGEAFVRLRKTERLQARCPYCLFAIPPFKPYGSFDEDGCQKRHTDPQEDFCDSSCRNCSLRSNQNGKMVFGIMRFNETDFRKHKKFVAVADDEPLWKYYRQQEIVVLNKKDYFDIIGNNNDQDFHVEFGYERSPECYIFPWRQNNKKKTDSRLCELVPRDDFVLKIQEFESKKGDSLNERKVNNDNDDDFDVEFEEKDKIDTLVAYNQCLNKENDYFKYFLDFGFSDLRQELSDKIEYEMDKDMGYRAKHCQKILKIKKYVSKLIDHGQKICVQRLLTKDIYDDDSKNKLSAYRHDNVVKSRNIDEWQLISKNDTLFENQYKFSHELLEVTKNFYSWDCRKFKHYHWNKLSFLRVHWSDVVGKMYDDFLHEIPFYLRRQDPAKLERSPPEQDSNSHLHEHQHEYELECKNNDDREEITVIMDYIKYIMNQGNAPCIGKYLEIFNIDFKNFSNSGDYYSEILHKTRVEREEDEARKKERSAWCELCNYPPNRRPMGWNEMKRHRKSPQHRINHLKAVARKTMGKISEQVEKMEKEEREPFDDGLINQESKIVENSDYEYKQPFSQPEKEKEKEKEKEEEKYQDEQGDGNTKNEIGSSSMNPPSPAKSVVSDLNEKNGNGDGIGDDRDEKHNVKHRTRDDRGKDEDSDEDVAVKTRSISNGRCNNDKNMKSDISSKKQMMHQKKEKSVSPPIDVDGYCINKYIGSSDSCGGMSTSACVVECFFCLYFVFYLFLFVFSIMFFLLLCRWHV